MRNPREILYDLVINTLSFDKGIMNSNWPKPGQFYLSRVPKKDREVLKQLTSNEAANVRWPFWI